MTVFTNTTTTLDLDTSKKLGRTLLLASSGVMDGANFVIRQRNRAADNWEILSNGVLAANQHWEHEIPVAAMFYQIELLIPTANSDVALTVNYAQAHDRSL